MIIIIQSAAKNFIKAHAPTIPLIPGYNGDDQSVERLEQEAKRIGMDSIAITAGDV